MKTFKILFILSICILPFLAGCPSRKAVITRVNRDGSCVRAIGDFDPRNFKGIDSLVSDLPVPVDGSWSLDTINDSTALIYKRFESVEALNIMYAHDKSVLSKCKRKVELKKEFKWFYTAFKYYETYSGVLREIPLDNYLLTTEINAWKSRGTEKYLTGEGLETRSVKALDENIEERLGYWLHDNIYSLAFDDIIDLADSMVLIDKETLDINELKDTIKYQIDQESKWIDIFDDKGQLGIEDFAGLIAGFMKMDSLSTVALKQEVSNANLEEKYEEEILFGFTEEYDHLVIMPGLLIDTNADEIHGDTLNWDMNPAKYIDSDYTVYAESRVTNLWAYIVSAVIVILAGVIPLLSHLKKKNVRSIQAG
jgi:hypothetical protein